MPQADPLTYLIAPITNMTGGLITDAQTLILGIVFILFLVLGFDLLSGILGSVFDNRRADKLLRDAKDIRLAQQTWNKGDAEYDYHEQLYRRFIRRSADLKAKRWKL